jgi:prepilin-type processing-associated H-X9-DG protein
VFVARTDVRFRDVSDGLSSTIMVAEVATDLGESNVRTRNNENVGTVEVQDQPTACRDEIDPRRPRFWLATAGLLSRANEGRGFRWANGNGLFTGCNTILPPNNELCVRFGPTGWGILPPSSQHPGGVHCLLADGSVTFLTDSIDAGDPNVGTVRLGGAGRRVAGSESPYGLWGALGTKASQEAIDGWGDQ